MMDTNMDNSIMAGGDGDYQCQTEPQWLASLDLKRELSKGDNVSVNLDESGDNEVTSILKQKSPNPKNYDESSSISAESASRKYLSIAQIVTTMKARWEVFAMENEIARCKSREKKNRQMNFATISCENVSTANKSFSAPHLFLPSGTQEQDLHKSLPCDTSTYSNKDKTNTMKKALSAEDIKMIRSNDNFYNIKKHSSNVNDFERDSIEWKTIDVSEIGSKGDIASERTCYTADEGSSEDLSICKPCSCPTHILSCELNSPKGSISSNEKELQSFGRTYTVGSVSSCKSCSKFTSSSFDAEAETRQMNKSNVDPLQNELDESTRLRLEELSREYDSVVLAKNEPVSWNVETSSTEINQRYNTFHDETPDQKICSNVSLDHNYLIMPIGNQKMCRRCTRAIFAGQAKFENPLKKLAWHKNCFRCIETTCQKELHTFDHILYNGQPYCYQHYIEKSKASRCKACSEFIIEEVYTYALNDYWHPNHFICGNCRNPLISSEFITIENNVICLPCHKTLFKKNCQSCGKLIEIHQRFVHSGDLCWHSNDSCMKCETCGNSLICRTRFYRKVGHLYCNRFCSQRRGPP